MEYKNRKLLTEDINAWLSLQDSRQTLEDAAIERSACNELIQSGLAYASFYKEQITGQVIVRYDSRPKLHHKCRVVDLYVLPDYRNEKIAHGLMEHVICDLKKSFEIVQCCVASDNVYAIKLFTGLGFIPYGLEPKALKENEDYVDLLEMYRELQIADLMITTNDTNGEK